ncbi:MAG: hypothetical protein WC250_03595 [Candidatus Paceibacterota bacterium]|jgi:hypothetical protein
MKKLILVALTMFLLVNGALSSAQTIDLTQNLSVTQNPERPRAYDTVSISVESYLVDLNSASITWSVNGKLSEKGTGNKTFKIKLGAVGSLTTVGLSIKARTGESIDKVFALRPSEVDLLWEAQTYTPPFYKGKALFSNQGRLRIIAVPNFKDSSGKTISAGNLIYTWKQDDQVLGNLSGYGKSTLIVDGPLLPILTTISVQAMTADSQLVAESRLSLRSLTPSILFYENNPLYGIMYHQAMGSAFTLRGSEITLAAEPYFFSGHEKTTLETTYDWQLNGVIVGDNENGEVTLRNDKAQTGQSILSLEITNSQKIYQSARQTLTLNFSSEGANPTF